MKKPFSKRIVNTAILASVLILLALPFALRKDTENITYTKMLMGTVVQITLMEGDRDNFENASEKAFDEIKKLEGRFSSYIPASDVAKISEAAGVEPVKVSPDVLKVTEEALKVAGLSGGAFDPTVGALGKVWGYSGEKEYVPSKEEVEKALPLVDYRKVTLDKENSTVMLKEKGMTLNLGGIAKGYIVARAVDVLKGERIKRGIIRAGGDMVVFQDGSKPFIIGIQHPREKKLLGEAHVLNGAVATSGDYERFFMKDGVRYHHILDPKTGFPANRSRSATIIADDATIADGLSTAVFVMGPEKGMELIERLENVEGVIVDAESKVSVSSGFKGKIY